MQIEIKKWNWYLRYLLLTTTIFSVGTRIILNIINGPTPIHTLRYFTLQTNLFLIIWISLSIIWRDSEKYDKITGFFKGAFTTYITITWLVFMILIEPDYDPVGLDWWTSLFNHYLNPFLFIIDFIASERKKIPWNWPIYWLAYPLLYLVFGLIWGELFGEYLYFFINIKELGVLGVTQWTIILSTIFYIFGNFYTWINHVLIGRNQETPSISKMQITE